ncbi:MAG: hypothetical protein JW818_09545 [Pirellulales bacterium]|nr:hypothetical protein [Pirellulales bacterium]
MSMPIGFRAVLCIAATVVLVVIGPLGHTGRAAESLAELSVRLGRETREAYKACPFSVFGSDYFSRYVRDPNARPAKGELMLGKSCAVVLPRDTSPLAKRMAEHLREFLSDRMHVETTVTRETPESQEGWRIILTEKGGGAPESPESFSLSVQDRVVRVAGHDSGGLRDGVVRLVDQMGLRLGPILREGKQVCRPRLRVRLGPVPMFGSNKDLVFLGYNAVLVQGGDLHALSTSSVIPELKERQVPRAVMKTVADVKAAQLYGLRTYALLNTTRKFSKDASVFQAHPDMRGALTWKADGEYVLCTEHPLVKKYLRDSIIGLFKEAPELDGIVVIIGGEGFYHCYMRPYGVKRGHTNCKRCEALGAEQVVANLCNLLADAARSVKPDAEVLAWPYSAKLWSKDDTQEEFIRLLGPGTGIFTEIEKDTVVHKPQGVAKLLWDYSIDLIGPSARAKAQIAACHARRIPVYLKSEPELSFEAARLPHVPCMDRWADRAEALASCGADGAWVFPACRPCYGTSTCDVNKLFWWTPHSDKESILTSLATRIAGRDAAPHLHKAWTHVSNAIEWSPELPPYYKGPTYLGPAHPMCADPSVELPRVFYGKYLFHAEMTEADGLKDTPTFITSPRGNVRVFEAYYKKMTDELRQAVAELDATQPLVPKQHALTFEAESSSIRWFYHTTRTVANFYTSCRLRDRLLVLREKEALSDEERIRGEKLCDEWLAVLKDEQENAQAALPLVQRDMRLDFYYGGDHTFPHAADMIRAKLERLQEEIKVFVPSVKAALKKAPEQVAHETPR